MPPRCLPSNLVPAALATNVSTVLPTSFQAQCGGESRSAISGGHQLEPLLPPTKNLAYSQNARLISLKLFASAKAMQWADRNKPLASRP